MSCVSSATAFMKEGLLPSFTKEEVACQSSCTAKVALLAPHILRTVAVYTAVGALSLSALASGSVFACAALGGVIGAVVGANCIAIKLSPLSDPDNILDNIADNLVRKTVWHAIWAGEKPILLLSALTTISCAIIGMAAVGIFGSFGSLAVVGSAAVLVALKSALILGGMIFLMFSAINLIIIIFASAST